MMQEIHFEATVKNGHIKIPERYSRLNNKKVIVDVFNKDTASEDKEDRVKHVKNFLLNCSGILETSPFPTDVTAKKIREMRLNDKYGL